MMKTDHNENLPKNRFKALDELEKRENLDNYSGKDLQEGLIYPIVAYNEFFCFSLYEYRLFLCGCSHFVE